MGGRGAEPGLTGSRESQVRPPPCQRAKENGSKTANCSWIGTSRSPSEELFDPPDGDPPEKERPPAGAGGAGGSGGGAVGFGGSGERLSAGEGAPVSGAFACSSAGAFASLSARSPTKPAAKATACPGNPLPIFSTRSTSPPPTHSGMNRSPTARPSPLVWSPVTPRLGGGPGSVTAADAVADADVDAVADADVDAAGCSGATLLAGALEGALSVAASRLGSAGPGSRIGGSASG